MKREELVEMLNVKIEQLLSDIYWAIENGDNITAKKLSVQLTAVEKVYNNL